MTVNVVTPLENRTVRPPRPLERPGGVATPSERCNMAERTCAVESCDRTLPAPGSGRGWCRAHYQRWYHNGDPLALKPAPLRVGTCSVCGVDVPAGRTGKLPSLCPEHKRLRRNARALDDWHRAHPFDAEIVCVDCAVSVTRSPSATTRVRCDDCRARYAAEACRQYSKAHPEMKREYYRENRERLAPYLKAGKHAVRLRDGAINVRYSRDAIFERDGWTCYLCKLPVDRTLKFPDAGSPTLDHVVTLSRGGDNSPDNVRLAHFGCNCAKGIKDVGEVSDG